MTNSRGGKRVFGYKDRADELAHAGLDILSVAVVMGVQQDGQFSTLTQDCNFPICLPTYKEAARVTGRNGLSRGIKRSDCVCMFDSAQRSILVHP